ncbi:MAG: hypothetical protein BSOLF_2910 [Candidatus Carbobacillus altaicus]|uniref:Uncharacterized protein n=1 Tax=Candidatus Carbonibacillus altaicus TaxID=2163959 RepID=A0A2R6XXR2_9BACL|nr:MAG: hypothetical protein BSOLF_2910 [Candidatus Carbobacillus altaicus]
MHYNTAFRLGRSIATFFLAVSSEYPISFRYLTVAIASNLSGVKRDSRVTSSLNSIWYPSFERRSRKLRPVSIRMYVSSNVIISVSKSFTIIALSSKEYGPISLSSKRNGRSAK